MTMYNDITTTLKTAKLDTLTVDATATSGGVVDISNNRGVNISFQYKEEGKDGTYLKVSSVKASNTAEEVKGVLTLTGTIETFNDNDDFIKSDSSSSTGALDQVNIPVADKGIIKKLGLRAKITKYKYIEPFFISDVAGNTAVYFVELGIGTKQPENQ